MKTEEKIAAGVLGVLAIINIPVTIGKVKTYFDARRQTKQMEEELSYVKRIIVPDTNAALEKLKSELEAAKEDDPMRRDFERLKAAAEALTK